jgi:hypothetical protein
MRTSRRKRHNKIETKSQTTEAIARDSKAQVGARSHIPKPNAARPTLPKTGPGRIKCCRIGSSAMSGKPELLLTFALVFFNQRRARTKNCGEGKEQTSCFRSKKLGDGSGHRCGQSTEYEAQHIFVPAALLECRPFTRTTIG